MNDTTVWCQNASVTEPQRDRGTATAVDEALERMIRRTMRRDCRGDREKFIL